MIYCNEPSTAPSCPTLGGGFGLTESIQKLKINSKDCNGLIDTGVSDNFIDIEFAKLLRLKIDRAQRAKLTLANKSFTNTLGQVEMNVKLLS